EEGKSELLEALRLRPSYAYPHYDLGKVLAAEGHDDEALEHLIAAVRFNPGHAPAYCSLGAMYQRRGLMSDAIASYRRAIEVDPDWPDGFSRLSLALLGASSASDSSAAREEAGRLARRAVELTGGRDALALEALSAVLAGTGKTSEAIEIAENALQLASEAGV